MLEAVSDQAFARNEFLQKIAKAFAQTSRITSPLQHRGLTKIIRHTPGKSLIFCLEKKVTLLLVSIKLATTLRASMRLSSRTVSSHIIVKHV